MKIGKSYIATIHTTSDRSGPCKMSEYRNQPFMTMGVSGGDVLSFVNYNTMDTSMKTGTPYILNVKNASIQKTTLRILPGYSTSNNSYDIKQALTETPTPIPNTVGVSYDDTIAPDTVFYFNRKDSTTIEPMIQGVEYKMTADWTGDSVFSNIALQMVNDPASGLCLVLAYSLENPTEVSFVFQEEPPKPVLFITGGNVWVNDTCEGRIVRYIPISLGSTSNHMVEVNILGGVSVTWSMEPITSASEALVLYFFPQCDRRMNFSFNWSITGTQ